MKEFELFRYLKRWCLLIIIICILGAFLSYRYLDNQQQYSASVKIEYTNPGAKNGLTPNNELIDVSEIYSSTVITRALESIGLSEAVSVDYVRSRISVNEVIPADEAIRKEALLDKGEEYVYNPTKYIVTFTVDSDKSTDFARNILDAVLNNYYSFYGEKYISGSVIPNNAVNVQSDAYDYIEMTELIDESVSEMTQYLQIYNEGASKFRSAETGYSFGDLHSSYNYIDTNKVPGLYSDILVTQLTKDKDFLVKKYTSRIQQSRLDAQNYQEKLAKLDTVISSYGNKIKSSQTIGSNGEETDSAYTDILNEVYSGDYLRRVGSTTTYDTLIEAYVKVRSDYEDALVDIDRSTMIIDVFSDVNGEAYTKYFGSADIPQAREAMKKSVNKDEINKTISSIVEEMNSLYDIVYATVDEYNRTLAAANVTSLTSINTTAKLNTVLYTALAAIFFIIFALLCAVIIGRFEDFLTFFMFTDKKTGLPNRTMCDMEIERRGDKLLKPDVCCAVIMLTSLADINKLHGYEVGNAVVSSFAKQLSGISKNYGFVGYNSGNQFLGFFENCSKERAEIYGRLLEMAVNEYNENHELTKLKCVYSYSVSGEENIRIRELLARAFKSESKVIGEDINVGEINI